MKKPEWNRLAIGDAVWIFKGCDRPMKPGRVADKVHEQSGIYTVLVNIAKNGRKPSYIYVSLEHIRRS